MVKFWNVNAMLKYILSQHKHGSYSKKFFCLHISGLEEVSQSQQAHI